MIRMAYRSLKKDFDRAAFYWIVFVLSSMFMYTFFHLAISDLVGVTFIYSDNTLPIYLTVYNVLICMIVIFLANDFYVKKKAREQAVLLVCGGTYLKLVQFLFLQTGILLVTAVPCGVILGQLVFPVLEQVMSLIAGYEIHIVSTGEAAVATFAIILFEVFWCTLLNLGFSYRNTIYSLMHGDKVEDVKLIRPIRSQGLKLMYLVLYVGSALLLYACKGNTSLMLALGVVGMFGLNGVIRKLLKPFLEKAVAERLSDRPETVVYMGLFRADLKLVEIYIFLFVATAIILVTMIASRVGNTVEMTLCLLSFMMLLPLLAMSLLFRFSTETVERKKTFEVLEKLGYQKDQLRSIKKKELLCLYGFLAGTSLWYIVNCLTALCTRNMIPDMAAHMIMGAFLLPLIICGYLSYLYYRA